jgi:hypothetical protein
VVEFGIARCGLPGVGAIEDLVAALGVDVGILKSEVSRIYAGWTNR